MIDHIDHVENYLKWLKDNMSQCEISPGIIEVTTPFLDRHNDYTQVYVRNKGDGAYIVSDNGYTLSDLEMCGVEFNTKKKKDILQQTLNRLGLKWNEVTEELYAECKQRSLAEVQHRLIQGMLDVNDMFYLSSPSIKSLFFEDVKNFFDINEIYYSESINVSGKSGFSHSFNFLLQRNKKHPERFIKLMNAATRNNVERYIFSWSDILAARNSMLKESKLIVCVNDSKKVNRSILDGFIEYGIDFFLWSDREKNVEKLA